MRHVAADVMIGPYQGGRKEGARVGPQQVGDGGL